MFLMVIFLGRNNLNVGHLNSVNTSLVRQWNWIVVNYENQPVIGGDINGPLVFSVAGKRMAIGLWDGA